MFPRGLATVHIDRENDLGEYWEPNIWIIHEARGGPPRLTTRGLEVQVWHVLAAAVAVALLARCADRAPSVPGHGAGRLRQVLRAWSAFPANATPRPLVLTGPAVADPVSGFPSGEAKLAYLEGAFRMPAALPSGPAAAAGFQLITAREAAGVLKSIAGKGPPVTTRLTVTGVRLGTAVFDTDRGPRQPLPADVGLAGVRDPAGVLAIARSRIFHAARSPGPTGARSWPTPGWAGAGAHAHGAVLRRSLGHGSLQRQLHPEPGVLPHGGSGRGAGT